MSGVVERIALFRHQRQLIHAPWQRPDIEYFFMIGGYGCGKTSGDVFFILSLCKKYEKQGLVVGVGGTTITLLRKTLIGELERILIMMGVDFSDDKNANIIKIGSVTLILIATEQPNLIYAYNFNVFICDEIDELPADKAQDAFKAIQERTRKVLPDGRVPFSVFTTTAQGYSGTYAIVESLRRLNQKFMLIRGLTKDNTSLSRTYVDRLYALYDENERLAYLEGKFVNLNTGRVYGDYDASVNMNAEPFDVDTIEVVMIGQDLNTGFSKGVAVTKKDKQIRIVKTFSFAQIAHAPRIIRNAFPMNPIIWYPDASGREVMTGYLEEIRSHDIMLRMGTVNPNIVERIFFVNKLFKTGRMILGRDCVELDTALKTRQYDDLGKPEKGKGPLAPDHLCDGLEYVVWRVVSSDSDFRDLWALSRTAKAQDPSVTRRAA